MHHLTKALALVCLLPCLSFAQDMDEHTVAGGDLPYQDYTLTSQEIRIAKVWEKKLRPDLYGGRPVKPGELPVSVYLGNCTATVVGPEALLTAGHCRASGGKISFTHGQTRHSGSCVRHPAYNKGSFMNNDFSLCKFSPKLELENYGSLKKHQIQKGDPIIMQGYGMGSGGKLNVGEAVAYQVDNQDIISQGRIHLGAGDSGGGLFRGGADLIKGPFYVVGVNSRAGGKTSLFNQTALDRSQEFFKSYAASQGVQVCGINWECYQTIPDRCNPEKIEVMETKLTYEAALKELLACINEDKEDITFR